MGKKFIFQQIVMGQVDTDMHKTDIGLPLHNIHKNYLKMDHNLNIKLKTYIV